MTLAAFYETICYANLIRIKVRKNQSHMFTVLYRGTWRDIPTELLDKYIYIGCAVHVVSDLAELTIYVKEI